MMAILLLLGYILLSPLEFSQLAKYSVAVFISVPNMLLMKSGDYFSSDSDLNPLLAARFKRSMAGEIALGKNG